MSPPPPRPSVVILHETNPAKYFPALYDLDARGEIDLAGAYRYSVVKEWLRAGLKDRTPFADRTRHALSDLWFRLRSRRLEGQVVVMGFAPWDWRLLLYRGLARRNRVIYHTSWHDWRLGHTPRQPVFRRWLSGLWRRFVSADAAAVVAVTPEVARSVAAETGAAAQIIPHAVPQVFYEAGRTRAIRPEEAPLRLLFVGEVSHKKGIPVLRQIMAELTDQPVSLTVVGRGVLADDLRASLAPNITCHGAITERAEMARVMAEHDVLVLPSQREAGWEELFGIVIVEALAAGLAVLASDHIGPRGILAPADGAGLFDESDHAGLTARIMDLATDPSRLDALRAAQTPLAAPYAIDAVASAWLHAIRSVTGKAGARPEPRPDPEARQA